MPVSMCPQTGVTLRAPLSLLNPQPPLKPLGTIVIQITTGQLVHTEKDSLAQSLCLCANKVLRYTGKAFHRFSIPKIGTGVYNVLLTTGLSQTLI